MRGFRNERLAHHVYRQMTQRIGLTQAHHFYTCAAGWHHWETTKENVNG